MLNVREWTNGTDTNNFLPPRHFTSPAYYVSPSLLDVSPVIETLGMIKIPIPAGPNGIDVDYFLSRLNKNTRSFLVVTPEIAKTGVTMTMQTRKTLYHLCYANGIPIVEMDEFRDLHRNALPPIKALDKHGIVFYTGSFCNLLHSSADTGWVVAAPELIEQLMFFQISMWEHTQVFPHQAMYEMLVSGRYHEYTAKLQIDMRMREDLLNSLLDKYLGDIATWNRKAEVFFWIKFHPHIDVDKIATNTDGLTVAEHSRYAFAEDNSVLVSLTFMKTEDLEPAIKLLSLIARKSVRH